MKTHRKLGVAFLVALYGLYLGTCLVVGGCASPSASQVVQVQTLKAVGLAAQVGIDTAARLYHSGDITKAQWEKAAEFWNHRWQPAFRVAVATVEAEGPAPADLTELAAEWAKLISDLHHKGVES